MRPAYCPLLLLVASQAISAAGPGVEGDWHGSLQAGAIQLRLAMHISRAQDGALSGSLDSLDQNANGIPLSKVTLAGRLLTVEIKAVGATYSAELNETGSELAGTFHQNGQDLPLALSRGQAPERSRPQNPKKPYPYDEEEVAYENTKAGVRLAGTLTLPRSPGPHPAVLLVTGSGPQDRDEAIMGHRPFLVIADYLTRRNIAVLRVDDRGVGKSTGNFQAATTSDFAADARAGVNFLKTRKEIDPKRIGLIGHSEGGIIAPMLAAQDSEVAFVVMLAGSGVTGEEVLIEQQYLLNRAMGMPEDAARKNNETERFILQTVLQEKDDAAVERKIREGLPKFVEFLPEDQRTAAMENIGKQTKLLTSPWFREFLSYDPRPALEKLKVPVLAMNGALDLQVPPKQNLPAIASALEAGGSPDYEIVKLPGLNHLFQTARTGAPSEYSGIEETISPTALKVMGDWIHRHVE
ncbi:MAG: alpha/beta fold hydrolase [Bryobacteraceae bacterium]